MARRPSPTEDKWMEVLPEMPAIPPSTDLQQTYLLNSLQIGHRRDDLGLE